MRRRMGLTLAEILIAMAIMSIAMLSMGLMLSKSGTLSANSSDRNRTGLEVGSLMRTLQAQLQRATWIDPKSTNNRLIFTTLNTDGTVSSYQYYLKAGASGVNQLWVSVDGGSTWSSPYIMSDTSLQSQTTASLSGLTSRYGLGSGQFLYCGYGNNCSQLSDTNANGVFDQGTDTAAIASGYSGTALSNGSQANKVVLSGWTFTRQGSNTTSVNRSLPDVFVRLQPPLVIAGTFVSGTWTSGTSYGLQGFSTNSGTFPNTFSVRGVAYDRNNRRLAVVGHVSSGTNYLYSVSRDGVPVSGSSVSAAINPSSLSSPQFDSVSWIDGSNNALVLDATAQNVYSISMTSGTVNSTASTSGIVTSPAAIAYDPNNSSYFYIIGTVSSNIKIVECNQSGGATGNSWSVPAGLTTANPPSGLVIDPLTGDFYALQKNVSGSGSSASLTVYHITRSSPTTTDTFSLNLSNAGSAATSGTTNYWGLGYDMTTNHVFLAEGYSGDNRVEEIIPTRLLSTTSATVTINGNTTTTNYWGFGM